MAADTRMMTNVASSS